MAEFRASTDLVRLSRLDYQGHDDLRRQVLSDFLALRPESEDTPDTIRRATILGLRHLAVDEQSISLVEDALSNMDPLADEGPVSSGYEVDVDGILTELTRRAEALQENGTSAELAAAMREEVELRLAPPPLPDPAASRNPVARTVAEVMVSIDIARTPSFETPFLADNFSIRAESYSEYLEQAIAEHQRWLREVARLRPQLTKEDPVIVLEETSGDEAEGVTSLQSQIAGIPDEVGQATLEEAIRHIAWDNPSAVWWDSSDEPGIILASGRITEERIFFSNGLLIFVEGNWNESALAELLPEGLPERGTISSQYHFVLPAEGLQAPDGAVPISVDRGWPMLFSIDQQGRLIIESADTPLYAWESVLVPVLTRLAVRLSTTGLEEDVVKPDEQSRQEAKAWAASGASNFPGAPVGRIPLDFYYDVELEQRWSPTGARQGIMDAGYLVHPYGPPSEHAWVKTQPSVWVSALRRLVNLLPGVNVGSSVAVIAGGLEEDTAGLAYGVAIRQRARTATGQVVPVVFLATPQQAGGLEELGIGSESIFVIGSAEYPTVAAGAEAATLYLQDGLGIANVVQLGVFEKVSLFVKQVLANLFGIELNPYESVQWQQVIETVAYTFRQA